MKSFGWMIFVAMILTSLCACSNGDGDDPTIDPPTGLAATPGDAQVSLSWDAITEASIQGTRDNQTYPYHLTAIEAGEVASWSGAEHLVLTHIGALLDPARSVEEASGAYAGPISYAAPGSMFEIG